MKRQNNVLKSLVQSLFLGLFLNCTLAHSNEIPHSMGSLGDSITAGALAAFNRQEALDPFAIPKFIYYLLRFEYLRSVKAIEARQLSWATGLGKKMKSHATRLTKLSAQEGRKFSAYNAAVSGASSQEIDAQVNDLLAWSVKTNKEAAPEYVVIDIGSNDACGSNLEEMTSAGDYAENVDAAVEKILSANPQSKILLGGIPNVIRLKEVAQDSPHASFNIFKTCKDVWKKMKICSNVLTEGDPEKIKAVSDRIDAYMHELENITDQKNISYGRERVRFAHELNNYEFNDNEISYDCFHPNIVGQQAISDVMWKKSWWAGDID